MKSAFQTLGIIGRVRNPKVRETLKALIEFLHSKNQAMVIEAETAQTLNLSEFTTMPREEIGKHCDLLIVVGGDGSMINASHAVIEHEVPVLGINRGSLGFLTDIHPAELNKIQAILDGQYISEQRFLLTASIEVDGKFTHTDNALNEVALIPDTNPQMMAFEIYIDDKFVCSQHSDGLIIATPTGSTAYALSGGGPILHPQLDAIVLVPMFPHTLTARPIVVEGNREIKIVVSPDNSNAARVSCDGQAFMTAPAGCHVTVRKKTKLLNLIHPLDYNYYKTLRSKLHWGKKLKNME